MPGAESSGLGLLAAELKAQRSRIGWTQAELGDKIGFSGSFVSDVERCERIPRIDFARACDREMELPGSLERLHELVRNAAFPSFFAPVVPFERESVRIHGFELGSVPGLLQTEAYARALIRATRPHDRDADVERLVMARLERQEIMTKDNPPLLWYVLDESVLHRIVGSRAVMAEQIDQLITAASGPSTVVQVLTFAEGEGVGADGPISIYEFREAPSVCYTETSSLSRGPRCTYGIGARTAPRRPGLPGPRGTQGNDAVDPG